MKFSLHRALIIARREYLTTVRRKAFVFSLLLTPAIMFVSIMLQKAGSDDTRAQGQQARIVAIVDSSGVFASLPRTYEFSNTPDSVQFSGGQLSKKAPKREVVPVVARAFTTQAEAVDSLGKGTVNTVLVIPPDFLRSGGLRRYERDTRTITTTADDRALRTWMMRYLMASTMDSVHIDRALSFNKTTDLYVPGRTGAYELKDDTRELWAFLLPFGLALMLGIAIITGGQYLLQGVAEEKETRILESLLCTVTPDELMIGKLVGLGGAGLTMVGIWMVFGLGAISGPMAMMKIELSPLLVLFGSLYFIFGYLFYASLMTGIGAITNNLREAQQMAMIFTMMNFVPFYALMKIMNSPKSALTVGMSLFPPTAPVTMMMRLSVSAVTGNQVPMWQIGASLGLLVVTALLTLRLSSKVFRVGLLLYGKTPNLPEIVRILRQD
jgi:ABC-2 type transport system permease protein